MNKNELIAAVAERANLTKKDSEAAVSALFEVISDALCDGDKVQLVGFGSFDKILKIFGEQYWELFYTVSNLRKY